MYQTKIILILSFGFIIQCGFSQQQIKKNEQINSSSDSASKVAWLKENAINIRSIDPKEEDFSDLMPLKNIIGDAQIVMLSENSHHIGTMHLAKARFIKFLHEQMGFDLLTFESDFYGVHKAWEMIHQGQNAREAFIKAVYFSSREEFRPLIDYVDKQSKSNHLLEIGGFDFALNGSIAYDSLISDLRKYFEKIGFKTESLADSSAFAIQVKNTTSWAGFKAPHIAVLDTFDILINAIDSLAPKPFDLQSQFYLQVLNSVKKFVQYHSVNQLASSLSGKERTSIEAFLFQMRDVQMANNLLWHVQQNPKRKIIVWAHAGHTLTCSEKELNSESNERKPSLYEFDILRMGALVKDSLKEKVYNIIITGNQGMDGVIYHLDSTKTFLRNIPHYLVSEELETLLEVAGFQYAYLDLRDIPPGGEWLKKSFPMRLDPVSKSVGEWRKAVDGVYYIQKYTPCNVKMKFLSLATKND